MSLYSKMIDLQKLQMAWKRVRSNKPASGIDNVTWEQFDDRLSEELKELNQELVDHKYVCKPVKQVTLYKEQKERIIALYTMRDKVVQQSVAQELDKIFSDTFSESAYAYRANKSALNAIGNIDRLIKEEQPKYVLKADITKYFDMIQWPKLEQALRKKICEDDVLELIHMIVMAPTVDNEGNLCGRKLGIHQGASISPILSNVYLTKFDQWIESECLFYARYSDDMVIFAPSQEQLQKLLPQMQNRLRDLGLTLSEKKTGLYKIEDGFTFLGYYFDHRGKAVTAKAKDQLAGRLEGVWFLSREDEIHVRLKKMAEILNGWEQYFRGERKPGDILEYTTAVFMLQARGRSLNSLPKRSEYTNFDREIMEYLIEVWDHAERKDLMLLEYEQFYGTFDQENKYSNEQISVLLAAYAEVQRDENAETLTELMQIYADMHGYRQAEAIAQCIKGLIDKPVRNIEIPAERNASAQTYSVTVMRKYLALFAGREDIYAEISYHDGRKHTEQVLSPLDVKAVQNHLQGERVLATYVQRQNSTVHYMVLDLDVSRKVLLESRTAPELFQKSMKKAGEAVQEIRRWFQKKGVSLGIEYSGGRGYHLWLFFEQWIPTYYCNLLQDYMEPEMKNVLGDELSLEFFPNKTRLKNGKSGQNIKLPLAVNEAAHVHSVLMNEDLTVNENLEQWIDNTPKYSLAVIKKILSYKKPANQKQQMKLVNTDLSDFGNLTPNIREILSKCNLLRYLLRKAYDTGYLTHFERLSMLYVFGHVGNDGKQFLHQVMGYTLNYKYNVTEKFIRKCPEKPISCLKLREQYKSVTAEIGCSCSFHRSERCYPSPVLHAISLSKQDAEQVTLPISRTVTKEKSKEITESLNIHSRAQALAEKLIGFKKQERGIRRSIEKNEKELEKIFEEEHIDFLELEMGILTRRKIDGGWDWMIEL